MKYNIDEVLVGAIMTKVPIVLVEGYDDIQFYEKLCIDSKKQVDVFAIETFENYGEGCNSVIKAVEDLQDQINKNSQILNYFLGIVDRDARFYRNELPNNLKGLFILKYYSFESHLVTDVNIQKILPLVTSINVSAIDVSILSFLKTNYTQVVSQLYYICLEALKNACVTNYDAVLGYSEKEGKIADRNSRNYLYSKVLEKKSDLDSFAEIKGINKNDLLLIAKGKWLIHAYANCVLENLKGLKDFCFRSSTRKCQYCRTGQKEKCLWKLKENYNFSQIANLLTNFYDEKEVAYIKERLNKLGETEEREAQRNAS